MSKLTDSDKAEMVAAVVEMIKRDFVLMPRVMMEIPFYSNSRFLDLTMRFIENEYGLTREILKSGSVKDEHVHARMIYAFLCRKYGPATLTNQRIVDEVMRLSHAFVIGAVHRIESRISNDDKFNSELTVIVNKFKEWMRAPDK